MSLPDDRPKGSPRDRFRNILSADKEDEGVPEARKPAVVNLPKVGEGAEQPQVPGRVTTPKSAALSPTGSKGSALLQRFWTAGAILSVVANFLLLFLLISGGRGLGGLSPLSSGEGALLGLYASLEQLDQAHLRATVPVQTTVALDASVPVKTSTNITLAKDVVIPGAHVTINTALFNIDAPANVTLPAGTSLDVALDMTLPMQTSLPIAVDVPVDIAVNATELHPAIRGLQDSLRPLLCASSPNAVLPDGSRVCP